MENIKRDAYLFFSIVLGFLLSFLVHAVVEIWYIGRLVDNFEIYSFGLSWSAWFFVHDVEAEEVSVEAYFTKTTNGGTFIPSVYQEVNRIVEEENLARDYNIYVFQGTDGDDDDDGQEAIPEIEKILSYVNRMGVSVLKSFRHLELKQENQFEQYVKAGGFTDRKDVFRMHLMSDSNVTDENNKQAVRALVAED